MRVCKKLSALRKLRLPEEAASGLRQVPMSGEVLSESQQKGRENKGNSALYGLEGNQELALPVAGIGGSGALDPLDEPAQFSDNLELELEDTFRVKDLMERYKYGDRGEGVKVLQEIVGAGVDGIWKDETQAKLGEFLKRSGDYTSSVIDLVALQVPSLNDESNANQGGVPRLCFPELPPLFGVRSMRAISSGRHVRKFFTQMDKLLMEVKLRVGQGVLPSLFIKKGGGWRNLIVRLIKL